MTATTAQPVAATAAPQADRFDAQTAWRQLGHWLPIRLGAKNKLNGAGFVQFDTSGLGPRSVRVTIGLAADDTYTVEIGRVARLDYNVIAQHEGIHCDVLAEVVERTVTEFYS